MRLRRARTAGAAPVADAAQRAPGQSRGQSSCSRGENSPAPAGSGPSVLPGRVVAKTAVDHGWDVGMAHAAHPDTGAAQIGRSGHGSTRPPRRDRRPAAATGPTADQRTSEELSGRLCRLDARGRLCRLRRAGARRREVACLGHVRHKFFDVHAAQGSAIAAEALERIAALYAIVEEAHGQPPERRVAIRRAIAAPRLGEFERRLRSQLGDPHNDTSSKCRQRWLRAPATTLNRRRIPTAYTPKRAPID